MTANHGAAASSSPSSPKPEPYRQAVAEATIDDDDVCALHPDTMKNLAISDGDVVLLKSKRRRERRCVAVSDAECPKRKAKINKAIRSDLRVGLSKSDVVFVYPCRDANSNGVRRPVDVAAGAGGLASGFFKACLKPFKELNELEWFMYVMSILPLIAIGLTYLLEGVGLL